ncbi:SIS domain-containing protein [Arthrobacter gandavensis]|uniref:SIS domain-containing protein n=1 Tax=Arthrobacter gandavensis TaxID=169960 RepID=UPI00188DE2B1|nr:SIS domain-containing protein [Arthrobacter gandavensis]MBF4992979.1 SIS domain-containing protein [Arthrobacter gandavensis]
MDTSRFLEDLQQVPEYLDGMAELLDGGYPGLAELPPAGRILILGMGSSAYAAATAARKARADGVNVQVELASTALLPAPAPDLLVVAVSATGTSVEVLAAAESYRGTGRLVAVTNRPESALAAMADFTVAMNAGEEVSGISCRNFRHSLLVIAALLERFGASYGMLAEAAQRAALGVRSVLDSSERWLPQASALLLGRDGTFLLAPAERFSSAAQGSLMIREVPRRPAYGSETGDWSHADVYLSKTLDYPALVFTGSRWDQQALDWMMPRGARVVAVGEGFPEAALTVSYPGQELWLVAALVETLVPELVAWDWYAKDPEHSWSSQVPAEPSP